MRYATFFCLLIFISNALFGQQNELFSVSGVPQIQNFTTEDYKAGAINYAIAQDARGVIYVANNRGLLEFDGSRWRQYQLPNPSAVYNVAIDSVGRIYVKAGEEMGYFAPNRNGMLNFQPAEITTLFDRNSIISKLNISFKPVDIVPYAAGQLMLITENGDFYLLDEESLVLQKKKFSASEFFKINKITTVEPLIDDNYAIGTRSGGLAIMNKNGELLYLVNKNDGLQNDFIRNIFQDNRGDLWIATNNGISFISFDSPFSLFDEKVGLKGAVTAAQVHDGFLYVGTRQGLFYKPWESSGNPYTDNWGFGQFENLSEAIQQLQKVSGQLYAITDNGTYRLESKGFHFLQEKEQYEFNEQYKLQVLNDKTWMGSMDQLLKLDYSTNLYDTLSTITNQIDGLKEIVKIEEDKEDNILIISNKGLHYFKKIGDNYENNSDIFSQFTNQPLYCINAIDRNNILIGSPRGLIHYNPNKGEKAQDQSEQKLVTLIRKVNVIGTDTAVFNGAFSKEDGQVIMQSSQQHEVLPWERKSLHFEVASPWFDQVEKTQYRYFLQNFDKDWSDWTVSSSIDYTNLPQGEYTFTAQSRNVYGVISAEATYDFTIEAPWFYRWWAYFIYFSLAALLYFIGIKVNAIRLQQINKQLEKEVEKRTIEIAEKNERLSELNEEKNHIIGVLAHDMRNPLHQIKGLVDLSDVRFPNIEPELKEYHKYMVQAVDRLNEMITKILDLKAIESGKVNMVLEPVNIHHLLNATADSLKAKAHNKEIELVKNDEIMEVKVKADKTYLLQVFENLVTNAIKFSPKNKSIYLELEKDKMSVTAIVKDEGPGLSKDDMSKLFGKFQKLSARPTDGEASTGLGLSIVKKYVEAMNGEVWCESEERKGAAFKVKFPITY